MLKYLEYQRACDTTFILFLVSWPYTRHFIYNRILYSAYFDAPGIFHRDNHDKPNYQQIPVRGGGQWKEGFSWNPQEGYYMTEEVHIAFIALLATLQAILCLWFAMIIRLALRVLRGAHAEDDRSDDEDDGQVEEDADPSDRTPPNRNIPGTSTAVSPNGIAFPNGIYQRNRVA
jgi:very-long-chain ceramide synthase